VTVVEMPIGYLSEPIQMYAAQLTTATTLADLHELLTRYQRVADDALALVKTWSETDFTDWRKALAAERRGQFMGDKAAARFSAVLMPEVLFRVGIVAEEYKVPWGCAYLRLREVGQLKEVEGIALLDGPPDAKEMAMKTEKDIAAMLLQRARTDFFAAQCYTSTLRRMLNEIPRVRGRVTIEAEALAAVLVLLDPPDAEEPR